jgi:hypothetical protein
MAPLCAGAATLTDRTTPPLAGTEPAAVTVKLQTNERAGKVCKSSHRTVSARN